MNTTKLSNLTDHKIKWKLQYKSAL